MVSVGAEKQRLYRVKYPERAKRDAKRVTESNHRLKIEVLTYYGNGRCACVRCGFKDIRALSVDHIEGGGNRERVGRLKNTRTFYRGLQQEDYPDGYQTLCMNCQWIKRFENGEHGTHGIPNV